jgi:post-segregation antitoxin (ccd killing protein)
MAKPKRVPVYVPEDLHGVLVERARQLGLSLSAYLRHAATMDCVAADVWPPKPEAKADGGAA